MSEEKPEKAFFLKIDVAQLNDKSFTFKVEGIMPISIQEAIKTAITGIKTVGPEVAKSIANLQTNAAERTEKAKKRFYFSKQKKQEEKKEEKGYVEV